MSLYDLVVAKIKDSAESLGQIDDILPAIDASLLRASEVRPLEAVADLSGTGLHDLDLPEGWAADFSRVLTIEYPVGNVPETMLPIEDFSLYRTPTGLVLRLTCEVPPLAEPVRVTFSQPRSEATLPVGDLDAVACLAAASCLRNLAARYAQSSDPSMSVDVVNYGSKADSYRRLAEALEGQYNLHFGIDPKGGVKAAGATATAAPASRPRLTHRRG